MRTILVLALVAVLAAASGDASLATETGAGGLRVEHPWARASIGASKTGAAYLTIVNHGEAVALLVGAATPVAEHAGLHTHLMEQGIMKMRPLEAVEVAPGEPTVFKPGGLHIMLMGLRRPLKEGETFPLTLTFRNAGPLEVEVPVLGATSMGHGDHMEHHQMHQQEAPTTN